MGLVAWSRHFEGIYGLGNFESPYWRKFTENFMGLVAWSRRFVVNLHRVLWFW